ncbi:MAG: DUF5711 family protein [Bacillota bacterium]|nr:DUF5711 family protein [Bacillota bacterium]
MAVEKNNPKAKRNSKRQQKSLPGFSRRIADKENDLQNGKSNNNSKLSKHQVKIVRRVVCILLACMTLVFVWANRESLTPEKISNWFHYDLMGKANGNGFPAQIVGTKVSPGNFTTLSGYPAYASDTSFLVLSEHAGELADRQLSYSDPMIKSNDKRAIIYNCGGTGFQTESIDNTLYKGTTSQKIQTADINSEGVYGIVTEASGFYSKLFVYGKDNTLKYTYSFSDYYMDSISINSDGKTAVASGFFSKNGDIDSVVYLLNFQSANPSAVYHTDNNFIYQVKYVSDHVAVAVGDNSVDIIDTKSGSVSKTSYNSKLLTAYDISYNNGAAISLSRSADGRACDIMYIDNDGQVQNTINTNLKITSLSLYDNKVGVIASGKAYIYMQSGSQMAESNAGVDATKGILVSSKLMYVLGISEVRAVSFE